MRVLHVITGMQKAAGTTTFVENVVKGLCKLGHDAEVCTRLPLLEAVNCPDIIHIHGLWSSLLHQTSVLAWQNGVPVVWSTHGMTAPWSMRHKWWKKIPAWWLYQKWDLKHAAAIHCTTDLELEWNQTLGFKKFFIAPLGTSLPDSAAGLGQRSRSTVENRILLFVGRVYPVKALDRLIEAFSRVDESVRCNWTLRLVGPDQAGHMAELMALCNRLGISYSTPEQESTIHCTTTTSDYNSTVQFAGPKFDQDLDNEYANCDCLALVSHTENFGATVVDAMAHGKPVITSTKTPWKVVADNNCGWWVDNDVATLAAALQEAFSTLGLDLLGRNGRALVESRYTWSAVCEKMVEGYDKAIVLRGTDKTLQAAARVIVGIVPRNAG